MNSYDVYIGTYTQPIRFGTGQILLGKGKGIYRLSSDSESGELNLLDVYEGIVNPSYFTFDRSGEYLYTVNETKEFENKSSGAVSAYKLDAETGKITFLNQLATGGTDPCHIVMNRSNTALYVSNFMSGSVAVFSVNTDGSIGSMIQFVQHRGSSIHPVRQITPHAHSLIFSHNEKYAFVPDLGIDKLMIYKVDPVTHLLEPAETPFLTTLPGAGPRHCELSANGEFCYLINELKSSISTIRFDEEHCALETIQEISTIPADCTTDNTCADIHMTRDGKFLYGSNRGHDSLAIYSIDQYTGKLSVLDYIPCGGKTPRNFGITPDDRFLIVACQDSDNLAIFEINHQDGSLKKAGECSVPTPVCIKFFTGGKHGN